MYFTVHYTQTYTSLHVIMTQYRSAHYSVESSDKARLVTVWGGMWQFYELIWSHRGNNTKLHIRWAECQTGVFSKFRCGVNSLCASFLSPSVCALFHLFLLPQDRRFVDGVDGRVTGVMFLSSELSITISISLCTQRDSEWQNGEWLSFIDAVIVAQMQISSLGGLAWL